MWQDLELPICQTLKIMEATSTNDGHWQGGSGVLAAKSNGEVRYFKGLTLTIDYIIVKYIKNR